MLKNWNKKMLRGYDVSVVISFCIDCVVSLCQGAGQSESFFWRRNIFYPTHSDCVQIAVGWSVPYALFRLIREHVYWHLQRSCSHPRWTGLRSEQRPSFPPWNLPVRKWSQSHGGMMIWVLTIVGFSWLYFIGYRIRTLFLGHLGQRTAPCRSCSRPSFRCMWPGYP